MTGKLLTGDSFGFERHVRAVRIVVSKIDQSIARREAPFGHAASCLSLRIPSYFDGLDHEGVVIANHRMPSLMVSGDPGSVHAPPDDFSRNARLPNQSELLQHQSGQIQVHSAIRFCRIASDNMAPSRATRLRVLRVSTWSLK